MSISRCIYISDEQEELIKKYKLNIQECFVQGLIISCLLQGEEKFLNEFNSNKIKKLFSFIEKEEKFIQKLKQQLMKGGNNGKCMSQEGKK